MEKGSDIMKIVLYREKLLGNLRSIQAITSPNGYFIGNIDINGNVHLSRFWINIAFTRFMEN